MLSRSNVSSCARSGRSTAISCRCWKRAIARGNCRRARACRPSGRSRSASRSAARPSSAPIASWSRAGCCAATSDAARSSARRPSPKGRRLRGAARSPRRRCASSDTTLRDVVRNSSDARLLSLAAGEPALDQFPNEAFHGGGRPRAARPIRRRRGATARPKGSRRCASAIADRYDVPRESVLILSGAQQGLDLLARCLIDPGDAVIIDRPGYLGAIQSFRAAGAKLIGWDIARADSDELEDLLVRYRPKLIYTNPTFQQPDRHDAADPRRGASCCRSRSATACRSSRTRRIATCISTTRRRRRCASSTTTTSSST